MRDCRLALVPVGHIADASEPRIIMNQVAGSGTGATDSYPKTDFFDRSIDPKRTFRLSDLQR